MAHSPGTCERVVEVGQVFALCLVFALGGLPLLRICASITWHSLNINNAQVIAGLIV